MERLIDLEECELQTENKVARRSYAPSWNENCAIARSIRKYVLKGL